MNDSQQAAAISAIADDPKAVFLATMARELHRAGVATDGLEETLTDIAASIGLTMQVFALPTQITIAVGPNWNQKLVMLRLPPGRGRAFNAALIGMCEESIREACGASHRLPSGPLHDAAEVARSGVPTAMMFVQSLRGISHNKIEDTREEHLELCVRAFDSLADKAIAWIASGG